jgi:hypothetical protein
MNYVKCADFFLTGLVVVWPVLLWTGNLEGGVAAGIPLLFGLLCCGMMVEDPEPL